ncbi:MAG: ROK family protein, partial [Alphaproteobacteria bacterium]|nr:ROK family protein [Alphaproteobacteria bacterium]
MVSKQTRKLNSPTKSRECRIGVDLGGTKTEIILINAQGDELYKRRVPSPVGNYEATVKNIINLVSDLEQEFGQSCPVGIGIPGCISPQTGLVKGANSTWLIGKPLQDDLSKALEREVRIDNDANCFALSESHALSLRPDLPHKLRDSSVPPSALSVFGVILGTGVGGGLVHAGELV